MNVGTASEQRWIPVAHLLRPQGRRGELLAEPLSDLPGLFAPGRQFQLTAVAASPGASRPELFRGQTGRLPSAHSPLQTLEESWTPTGRNAGRVVLKLRGVDSISAAETLAGRELLLAEQDLGARDPDTFLVGDLLGCVLYDRGQAVGKVIDVQFVTTPDGRLRLEDVAPLLVLEQSKVPLSRSLPVDHLTGKAPADERQSEPPQSSASIAQGSPNDDGTALVPFIKAWLLDVDPEAHTIHMELPEGLLDV